MAAGEQAAQSVTQHQMCEEIDHAITDHLAWLKDWHRAILCGGGGGDDHHELDRFGTWYLRNRNRGLVDQPAIHHLAELHRDMHRRATQLRERAAAGTPIDPAAYEAMMDRLAAFISYARRVEKAFTAASAELDSLTGLHNRHSMIRDLRRERARTSRSGGCFSVAIVDLDHFKAINDTHGHAAGDRVLAATAECFLGNLRPYDTVYRYGGEEFLIALPDTPASAAETVLDRVRRRLSAQDIHLPAGGTVRVSFSAGIAEIAAGTTVEQAIDAADRALYQAKSGGRDRVCVWQSAS